MEDWYEVKRVLDEVPLEKKIALLESEILDSKDASRDREDGELITASAYQGKTIDVQGVVDYYSGTYQIKVFAPEDITVH